MTVPYTFANRTDTIPLAELDANFAAADSVVWGTVTGTLSDQVDLQAALNGKDAAGAAAAAQAASTPIAHATDTANPHTVTKTQVGLGNVDNTSDTNKPVSTAQQTALNLKANATDVSNVDNTSDATKNAATATLTNKTILAATNTVEATSAPNGSAFGFRNKIINGDMRIDQRNNGAAIGQGFSVDRWNTYLVAGSSILQGRTPLADAIRAVVGWDFNYAWTAYTGDAVSAVALLHPIEGVKTLAGKTVTLSFWAWSSAGTNIISAQLDHAFGTGGSPSSTVTIPLTLSATSVGTTPVKITATATLPSISGKTLGSDGNDYLGVQIFKIAGNVNNLAITGVQLEEGSIATPFEHHPYGLELSLCQRYYQTVEMRLSGYTSAGIAEQYQMALAVRMRVTPTTTTGVTTAVNVTGPALFLVDAGHTGFGALGIAAGGYIATAAGTLSAEL